MNKAIKRERNRSIQCNGCFIPEPWWAVLGVFFKTFLISIVAMVTTTNPANYL